MNELLFFAHTVFISVFALIALALGKEILIAFICLQSILANLFVIKPIMLCGLTATGADAFTIGAVFGFHLLQEFYGRSITQKTIWGSFLLLIFFLIAGYIHLGYLPHSSDLSQEHFCALFSLMPRIALASLTSYLITQHIDCLVFDVMKHYFKSNYLPLRNLVCASFSQALDTILFSMLGLYGIIEHIGQIILVSFIIKLIALVLTTPFMLGAKRIFKQSQQQA